MDNTQNNPRYPNNGLGERIRRNPFYGGDGFAETRAQLDELAQQAEGSHRQYMGKCDAD